MTEDWVARIQDTMIDSPKDEWEKGFNKGLEWAIRIIKKDKSAY